jgi:hypothetical protein
MSRVIVPARSPSVADAVVHPASRTTSFSGLALCVSSFPGSFAPFQSRAEQVGHPASFATALRLTVAFDPSGRRPVALASRAIWPPVAFPTVGEGQPASFAAPGSFQKIGRVPSGRTFP